MHALASFGSLGCSLARSDAMWNKKGIPKPREGDFVGIVKQRSISFSHFHGVSARLAEDQKTLQRTSEPIGADGMGLADSGQGRPTVKKRGSGLAASDQGEYASARRKHKVLLEKSKKSCLHKFLKI